MASFTSAPRLTENSPYQVSTVNERTSSAHTSSSQERTQTSIEPSSFNIRRPSKTPPPPQLPLLQSSVSNSPSYARQRTPVAESSPANATTNPDVASITTNNSNTINGSGIVNAGTNASNGYRPLNVKDALTYLDQVKMKFSEKPEVYNRFLDIMKEFKSQAIDTPGVIERVSTLFKGHPSLISGFNTFLPPGYRIECSTDAYSRDIIKVTTPSGVSSTTHGEPLNLQQSETSNRYYSSKLQNSTTVSTDENRTRRAPVEFNHAINYVNKIKTRFANNPDTYKQFLEILQTYQKEQKSIQEVYSQVQILFDGATDLLAEFKQFLPDTTAQPLQLSPHHYPPLTEQKGTKIKKRSFIGLPKQKRNKTHHLLDSSSSKEEDGPVISVVESEFFDRVKKYIGNRQTYYSFLRVLNLFSQQILDTNALIERCESFLGGQKELFDQLKRLVGYDGKNHIIENVPIAPKTDYGISVQYGPSYRSVPKSGQTQNCSGRDALCWEVLNDEFISHPTWASEDSGFIASKKNIYEEALHRVEEERYDYDINIEANLNTISLLEPIAKKIATMMEDEKINFKLSPGLGGPSKTIYQRIIKKIYGKVQGAEIIDMLHNHPAQTVPVVLKRLRQKDEEWRRSQREWNKVWREVEIKNYYKALDYQGIVFKTNDRKMMSVKYLVNQIEALRLDQINDENQLGNMEPQLIYEFKSKKVFKDVTRVLYSYFDRQTLYGHEDCEIMKAFIEMFLPIFFDVPDVLPEPKQDSVTDISLEEEEEEEGRGGGEEEEREDIDGNETMEDEDEEDNDTQNSYDSTDTSLKKQKIIVKEDNNEEEEEMMDPHKEQKIYNFFGNPTFYCFFRLFQMCYERLYKMKQIDRDYRYNGEKAKLMTKAALELNITSATFNSIKMDFKTGYYKTLLDLIDKFFDDEIDQHVFEECTRYLFGNQAYILFTIDKLMLAIMRQLHYIVTDPKAQELLSFFKKNHEYEKMKPELTQAYRLEVTEALGEDDVLYNLAFDTLNRTLSIQLLEKEDETFELNDIESYTEYVTNYTSWDIDTPGVSLHTGERLKALRALFHSEDQDVDAFLIPSEDAHQSEYSADCDLRRAWISGFNGSAGFAIVSKDEAVLFTDGRYFLQASEQLDENWVLMKQGLPGVPTWQEYLVNKLPAGSRIGLDATLITASDAHDLQARLDTVQSQLVPIKRNLVDIAWANERPLPPYDKVFIHPIEYAGESHHDKLDKLRQHLKKNNRYGVIISALDEVAWLFNLRGSDVDCNPVFYAYALITQEDSILYINSEKLTTDVLQHLEGIIIKTYDDVFNDLRQLKNTLSLVNQKILIDNSTSLAIEEAIGSEFVYEERSFVNDAKAIKNERELKGMRECHIRDGAALVQFFAWLEKELVSGKEIDEVQAADHLEKLRASQSDYVGLSFPTISSTGPNGAIIHYEPERGNCKMIDPNQIYLCDSGAQYKDGTTDVTRTLHFGTPTQYEKACFTAVLQGHIALDTAVFPTGTTGYLLDPFARMPLWRQGLDYRHGTGHGVGSFLNVHEGPHGIGVRAPYNNTPLAAGMTVTDEPGYYEDGKFGIRIENILIIRNADTPNNFGGCNYLEFEHVTMVPIGLNLIDESLLSSAEKQWINDYHAECYEKLSPLIASDPDAIAWLKKETRPL
ncbi:uncharacterized protein BX663DRAFT_424720 [Cokeromyces recurvatus]|uniref:uncharacterized protein n=1 Tax=Cokeromyces recurvatus TaxID=90255 RepID=UPI00221EDA36|nr:uncharacterized protein BX663DRAFT_424720 [Cokeromyces recurvatus]KAI7907495.1 hypothetical protein BX663DRAFT_424720 [Cokeromyces recurvatus]